MITASLDDALQKSVTFGLQQSQDLIRQHGWDSVEVKNKALAAASVYAIARFPDTLKAVGLDMSDTAAVQTAVADRAGPCFPACGRGRRSLARDPAANGAEPVGHARPRQLRQRHHQPDQGRRGLNPKFVPWSAALTHNLRILSLLTSCLLLTACQTQLAPAYDQLVATELATANNDIQALFVSVGTSATPASYPTRMPAYNHIIAELNATQLQIKARPLPNPDALESANKVLSAADRIPADPNFSDYPSGRSVNDLAGTIAQMQKSDQAAGLAGGEITAFENQANIFLSQAIAYENFLKR